MESDKKSATWPADLAASVPTAAGKCAKRQLPPFASDRKAAGLLPHSTAPTARLNPKDAEVGELKFGVGDGIRTRDVQIHSLGINSYLVGLPCTLLHPAPWFYTVFGA